MPPNFDTARPPTNAKFAIPSCSPALLPDIMSTIRARPVGMNIPTAIPKSVPIMITCDRSWAIKKRILPMVPKQADINSSGLRPILSAIRPAGYKVIRIVVPTVIANIPTAEAGLSNLITSCKYR